MSKILEDAVRRGDLADVRGALWTSLMFDKDSTRHFDDGLKFVLGTISETSLYEKDDGEPFEELSTSDNVDKLMGLLRVNFSRHKIESLKRMKKTLAAKKADTRLGAAKPVSGGAGTGGRSAAGAARSDRDRYRSLLIVAIALGVAVLGAAAYGLYRLYR